MSLQNSSTSQQASTHANPVFGAIIDAQGREIPITEQMIQKACQDLEKSREQTAKKA
ncbi:PA1571 family protein [Pseudomonas defluvii]|uniref:PA1571 family protein n=1 Tax=Pseudomonas defluvii TaxID=1876757 RepID=UPI003906CF29